MSLSVIQSPQPSPTFGCDWQPFANHLAAALSQLRDKQYLILEVAQRQRYVQFADDVNHGWPLRKEIMLRVRNAMPFLERVPWAVRHTPDADRPPV